MAGIKFHVEHGDKKNVFIQCSGREDQTLKEAIEKQEGSILSSPIHRYVFKATVNIKGFVSGEPREVIVSQELPCGWLEQGTRIRTYKLSESKAKKIFDRQMQVEKSRVSDQILFFINLDRPSKSRVITHIPYGEYKVKYLCVLAKKDETVLNALQNDGRFIEPEEWTLHSTNTTSDVLLSSKAELCENYFFDVKRIRGKSRSESKTCPRSNIQIKAEKLEEDEFMGYSGDEYSGDESNGGKNEDAKIYQEILQFAKKYAYTWLEREKLGNLAALIEESFSKPIDQTKSVWLMERLVSASKSVGHIYTEGYLGGTCFLIRKDVILTNYHVYDQIKNCIAKHRDPSKVIVSFNYLLPNKKDGLEEVDIDCVYAENKERSLDYIFLGLKKASDQPALSDDISVDNPEDFTGDTVTVIGHPDGLEKKMDPDCRIISQYLWRNELIGRVATLKPNEFPPLLTCKQEISSDAYKYKIAYDSSFFHGASGSPVFDDNGKVIAMHTCGWIEKEAKEDVFVMEFAVHMAAIYNDCCCRNSDAAKYLFPSTTMEIGSD